MPWTHCDLDLHDDQSSCPTCGQSKDQWTVELGRTRTISIQTRRALFRFVLVDAAEEPVPRRPFELRVTDGTWHAGELDDDGFAKVPSPAEGHGLLRLHGLRLGEVQRLSPSRDAPGQVLRSGAGGAAVVELQELLVERGYPVEVDGAFGPETEGAVRWFQADRGLDVDGAVGPATWEALGGPAAAPPPPGGLLRQGEQGSKVRRLQEALNANGAALEVDGRFGPDTEAALRRFQSSHALEADGVAGPRTWAALLRDGTPATLGCATDRKHVYQLTPAAAAPAAFQLELYDVRLPDDAVLVAEGLAAPRRMRAGDHHEPASRRHVFPFPDPRPGPVCRATLELRGAAHVLFEGVDLAALASGRSQAPVFVRWPVDAGDEPGEEPAPDGDDLDAEWSGDLAPPDDDGPRLVLGPLDHDGYDPGSHGWGEN